MKDITTGVLRTFLLSPKIQFFGGHRNTLTVWNMLSSHSVSILKYGQGAEMVSGGFHMDPVLKPDERACVPSGRRR
jgi:hypothetical protein